MQKQSKIFYKGQEIKIHDERCSINKEFYFIICGIFFKNDNNPIIYLNDPNNLFLINLNATKHFIL